jgi:hypothetical protein
LSWATRAAANLLPLSREQSSLAGALREWRYTVNYNDLEIPSADCELCDHPDIRYQFEIKNLYTADTLLIGSECIHRFGITATDEQGRTLDAEETHKKVEKDRRHLVDTARKRRVVNSLVALANIDTEFKILSFLDYLHTRGAFTPKQVTTLFWRLEKYSIPFTPRDFKLTIRRNREKTQLAKLTDWQLQRLLPCLSDSQRAYLSDIGRLPI